jgi:hypothetical protein
MSKIFVGAAVVAAMVLGSTGAMAKGKSKRAKVQVTEESSSNYGYEFPDDPLAALGADGTGPIIKVRRIGVRMTLIRPRAHFIPEMVKSVENL